MRGAGELEDLLFQVDNRRNHVLDQLPELEKRSHSERNSNEPGRTKEERARKRKRGRKPVSKRARKCH